MTASHDHDHVHEHEHGEEHEHHHHQHVDYGDAVRAFRAERDAFFRSNPRSPLPEAERSGFPGLPYFPVDEALVFEELTLEPYGGSEPTSFAIPTSDGKLRPAERRHVLAAPRASGPRERSCQPPRPLDAAREPRQRKRHRQIECRHT